ncbi:MULTISPECIES: hypothetical protein [unclassified Ruegeria]|uniref:hypothetical protein n=1 Tax=unclassified Ruegeria TaxID=2625375 RepID=UPI001ADA61B2|nr:MULTISPECIES: hypothetical protein [unclassified Ruegeria]MBO9413667.1 hypothetical protein [Ruegeria sp. R8_1]MBO9417726.1 hypothetical protein [Ruegeria sp. R8_2]
MELAPEGLARNKRRSHPRIASCRWKSKELLIGFLKGHFFEDVMTNPIAESLDRVATALSTPPTSVSDLGGLYSFLYTWQGYIIPAATIAVGIIALHAQRTSQNLQNAEFDQMKQAGILRALRGEISTNIYRLIPWIMVIEKEGSVKTISITQDVYTANIGRVGFQSARVFAMMNITNSRLADTLEVAKTAEEAKEVSEYVRQLTGHLIAIATYTEMAIGVVPSRTSIISRAQLDKKGKLATNLSDLSDNDFDAYIAKFTKSEQPILYECLNAWKRAHELQDTDPGKKKPGFRVSLFRRQDPLSTGAGIHGYK